MDRVFPFMKSMRNDSPEPSTTAVVAEKAKDLIAAPLGLASSSKDSVSSEGDMLKWKRSFDVHANVDKDGQKYLDESAFVKAIAPPSDLARIGPKQYGILFRVADSTRRGLVSWDDFVTFETLLRRPDAEFVVAFKVFDVDGNGEVTFDEFKNTFQTMMGKEAIPFNFDSPWVKLYLGKRARSGEHVLGYDEFTQLMKGLQGERLRQAFAYFDKDETGYISPENFARIIRELARHKLSESVLERLPTLTNLTAGRKISYSEVIAFHNVLREMDLAERIIREGCEHSKDGRIDRNDFLTIASRTSRYGVFSPMEASIIFHFAGLGNHQARLNLHDFAQLLDPKWERPEESTSEVVKKGSTITEVFKSAYNFALGGLAGATGATAVYPIDLVKTRMQNQRSKVVGELLYKNSMDCVRKVYKNEGFAGFYRGLPPQLIGVAPEKAIKLTVNDLVRGHAKDKQTGAITLPWELFAGGAAGGCQVVFTNPLEIVKIRLQMQGEAAKRSGGDVVPRGAVHIIKQLGLVGLYKGATACLCRDIPFSAIYFPGYAHLKKDVFHEGKNGKKLSFMETLGAAAIAGMPAAYLTTPADVVKTRLQTEARKGETTYNGVVHCFRTILSEEGPQALFKGGPARILRSSPQFGVTLVAYEYLQAIFPYPFDDKAAVKAVPAPAEDLSRIRARNALKILLDVHENFAVRS